ncbi:molybdopterin synthase sulfur carrier subunit [Pseudomonas daroniae]|uniref:Molybdopterin synthase sulfur carrier subunit n=1 Tax=Phytopseudomonas daroniae TaxID=2487519 RepID=A0A4Q9QNB5_9GAMM|nr:MULTISPECIES: MoaD/ThiS family protein [Pseudomonas]TBU80734.1 molybdopterin synthase sulfur carrier subunit [Pseudomonas daroniae]TBU81769.1 molybdopterin synthase sulfur carrier subunit [Pseudomonas sp. FRB 228]TBU90758.1 molybdopterin synthase sulfur carrier subunit [Pseudomonas daroniae]
MIRVQYFARYRETLGLDAEELQPDFANLDELRQHLLARGGTWEVLAERGLMCARNEELCALTEPLVDGDAVAFFPTVTGG